MDLINIDDFLRALSPVPLRSPDELILRVISLRSSLRLICSAPSITISRKTERVCTATITLTPSPCGCAKMRTFRIDAGLVKVLDILLDDLRRNMAGPPLSAFAPESALCSPWLGPVYSTSIARMMGRGGAACGALLRRLRPTPCTRAARKRMRTRLLERGAAHRSGKMSHRLRSAAPRERTHAEQAAISVKKMAIVKARIFHAVAGVRRP